MNLSGGGTPELEISQDVRSFEGHAVIKKINEISLPSCTLDFRSSDNKLQKPKKHKCVLSLAKKINLCHNSVMQHHNNRLTLLKRKCAFTLSEYDTHADPPNKQCKYAFTLAEVLITLGIIGVVAAITLPSVIQNYRNHSVEAKLKKFYSTINQAVVRSTADNGDVTIWWQDLDSTLQSGDDGKLSSPGLEWFNTYIGKYMNIVEIRKTSLDRPLFMLADGTSFAFLNPGTTRDYVFFTMDYDDCLKFGNSLESREYLGVCGFAFIFNPTFTDSGHKNKYFEPYAHNWDGTETQLQNKCERTGAFCTKLIQYNGWKIPKNYPRKPR